MANTIRTHIVGSGSITVAGALHSEVSRHVGYNPLHGRDAP